MAVVEPMTTESASSAARSSAGSLHLCCTLLRSVAEVRLARTWHALGASEKRDLQLGGKELVRIRFAEVSGSGDVQHSRAKAPMCSSRMAVFGQGADLEKLLVDIEPVEHAHSPTESLGEGLGRTTRIYSRSWRSRPSRGGKPGKTSRSKLML